MKMKVSPANADMTTVKSVVCATCPGNKMCSRECGNCGRYDYNYKDGYCNWYERGGISPSKDAEDCSHYV